MTERLYYTDATCLRFDATVVEVAGAAGDERSSTVDVVLDRTAFYPTSGGQPHDVGLLGGRPVVDVIDRDDGDIAHRLAWSGEPIIAGARVAGEIDAARRRDHMQQHTGQHVLSAAFDRLGVRTMSFHLGADSSTIDLAREVSAVEIAQAEREACRVVFEDRPVSVRFVSEEEAARLPLRKDPARSGTLRLIDVEAFDLSACGGTHVARTGEIGLIAVSAAERYKGASRITFVCGARALASHASLRDVVAAASRTLSVAGTDVPGAVDRLLGDVKHSQRQVARLMEALAESRAEGLRALAETIGVVRVVIREEPDLDAAALKTLAAAIVRDSGLVAVLTGGGTPVPVVAARSADVSWDAGHWIKDVAARLGGRGGGRPELAQGGISATPDTILSAARESLSATATDDARGAGRRP